MTEKRTNHDKAPRTLILRGIVRHRHQLSTAFDELYRNNKQVAQLSQRDRAARWVSFGQKWKTGTGRQYFADTVGLSSTTGT